jgi:hypothetical protein
MYFQVESPRTNIEDVPNKSDANLRWYFVRQKLLMFKAGETHPDKAKLMLSICSSEKQANDVKPFEAGFYVLDEEAFHLNATAANREPELACNFTKLRLMTDKDFVYHGIEKPADSLPKKFGA